MKFKPLIFSIIFLFISAQLYSQLVLDFQVTDTDGVEHKLYEDYLDQGEIVVIKLFFSSCPICRASIEPFQQLYEELGSGQDGVKFLLLNTLALENDEDVIAFKSEFGVTIPAASKDGGSDLAVNQFRNGRYGPYYGVPVFIVIEPNGEVYFDLDGADIYGTMDVIKETINEVKEKLEEEENIPTDVHIQMIPQDTETVPDYRIYLRSANKPSVIYQVPPDFTFPGTDAPDIENPEIFIRFFQSDYSNITTWDLVQIQRYILGFIEFDNLQKAAADVNGSGSITATDLIAMRKLILGLSDDFPVGGSFLAVGGSCETDPSACKTVFKIDTKIPSQEISFRILKYGDVK